MSLFSRPRFSERHLLTMLLVALLTLATTLLIRATTGGWATPDPSRPPAPTPIELSAEAMLARLQDKLRQNPEDTVAYAQLGLAYLQRVRETGDPSFYNLAEKALAEALQREPQQLEALIGQGMLALARHDFETALVWAEQAQAINPFRAQILGISVDALVELGRYEEAVKTLQAMVDLRPDLASYSRVSYLRELHGDMAGAIAAMQWAVDASQPGSESMLWVQTQLGHLYFNQGDFQRAEEIYRQTLLFNPEYVYAMAGLARAQAARGNTTAAIASYRDVVERLPLPEFVIALGELYEATGQAEEAARQYDLVRVMQKLNASAGVDVDLELALFEVEHGNDPARALQQARAAYERRPNIYAADTLAWALYHNGRYAEARAYSQEALRLGSRDAMLHYHAGMIAYALEDLAAARAYLQEALAINPAFSIRHAPRAQILLAELGSDQASSADEP